MFSRQHFYKVFQVQTGTTPPNSTKNIKTLRHSNLEYFCYSATVLQFDFGIIEPQKYGLYYILYIYNI